MLKLIRWLLSFLLGRTDNAIAQQTADTAQQHHLEDQVHAVHEAQANAPADAAAFADSVRRGDAL